MFEVSRQSGIGVLLAALAFLCSSAAHAQWSGSATAGFGRGLGAIALSQGNLTLGRNALRERAARQAQGQGGAALRTPTRREAEALTYTPDPQVSEKVRISMIELASVTNPASRPQFERALADDAILRDFDNLLAANGYSRLNFADNIAMLLAVCWEIANGRDATRAQIRGARDQARGVALASPTLRTLPNVERQTLAETIAYQVLFLHAAKLAAERSGNQPQLTEVRESAAKAASQYGIDVSHMTLTERGFRRL
jgi:hypothetical protein